jgi:hypothetical protein
MTSDSQWCMKQPRMHPRYRLSCVALAGKVQTGGKRDGMFFYRDFNAARTTDKGAETAGSRAEEYAIFATSHSAQIHIKC